MTKRSNKIVLFSILVSIAIISITIYLVWNKPHKNIKDADAVPITAVELYNSFISDSVKARSVYTDKIVKVSGEIVKVSVNQQSQQIILLKTALPDASVNCTMEEKTTLFRSGEIITIKGICSGYISGDPEMGLPGDVFVIRGYHTK